MMNTSVHNPANANPSPTLAGPALANFADGMMHTATIKYDGNVTLSVFLDNSSTAIATATLTSPLNNFLGLSGNPAYVGFTAATGDAQENADILNWTWSY